MSIHVTNDGENPSTLEHPTRSCIACYSKDKVHHFNCYFLTKPLGDRCNYDHSKFILKKKCKYNEDRDKYATVIQVITNTRVINGPLWE
jgi:hypothetical protein